ncbi:hypothetical protein ACFL0Y_04105 [Patescibacteria group bacterium]
MSLKEKFSYGPRKTPQEMALRPELSLALKSLVGTVQFRLFSNQVDRNVDNGLLPEDNHYHAFFALAGGEGAVLRLTSMGPPQEPGKSGLFIEIHEPSKNGAQSALSLQTVKNPDSVDDSQVRWVSCFSPSQLLELSEAIETAEPITPQEYQRLRLSSS